MTNIEQQARDAHQRKVENAVRNVLVDALAWASTYGSVIPGHQWDEMRDAKVAGYLTMFAALSAPDNAEGDDLDSFIAKQPKHIQEAIDRRYRELSADNAEVECKPHKFQVDEEHPTHECCQQCGVVRSSNPTPAATTDNAGAEKMHPDWLACNSIDELAKGLVANAGLGSTSAFATDVRQCLIRAQQLANSTPAARVSEEDLMLCEHAARTCDENNLLFRAAAIRRLILAHEGRR